MAVKHFLDIDQFDTGTLRAILEEASTMKAAGRPDGGATLLPQTCVLAMLFDKPSTRTRVSFDMAMRHLGGQTIVLNSSEMQLGRGETIADTARVLSRYVDAIMLRTGPHANLTELADNASIPVINGLTDRSHPCQVMADIQTFEEFRGPVAGRSVAWIGDGNNVANSWIHAAVRFGFELRLACPDALSPQAALLEWARGEGGKITLTTDPRAAAAGADAIVTDVWVSMGDSDAPKRKKLLSPYQVDEALMAHAAQDAVFMHCLPAHRGDEVTAGVIDGPQSIVFDEAENRLYTQKAILAWCFGRA
ncbi:MAG: ornithine carbamoyltransferase [Hyphomicrobiales bacterium]|nr:ornithine carbamoyltransferase [Hyphomicrobiales bacterium]